MKNHTTFRVGGPADIFLTPSAEELPAVLSVCREERVPVTVIGNGSNLLVGDQGIRGVVICIGSGMRGIRVDGEKIFLEAGVTLAAAAQQAAFSGVALLATAHAGSLEQVLKRPGYRALLESGAFEYVIELEQYRIRRMERIGDDLEAGRGRVCGGGIADEWTGGTAESQQEAGAFKTAAAWAGAAAGGDGAAHGVAPRTV